MPLPSLEKITPTFPVLIPSTQETITFRPFLVKEEKLLLMALEDKDEKVMLDAICQVVQQCAMSALKVDDLAVFDIEYIFLRLRAKSVNSVAEIAYECHNEIEVTADEAKKRQKGPKTLPRRSPGVDVQEQAVESQELVRVRCNNVVKLSIDLEAVDVQFNAEHKQNILLTDTLGVTMRYPSVGMAKRVAKKTTTEETVSDALEGIALCVKAVFDEQNVYTDFTAKEVGEWVEKLTQTQFTKIQEFFNTMPKLSQTLVFHCDKCGYSTDIHLEGLASFFE